MQINHSHLLIDTCCLLNLCASGELLNILQVVLISAQASIVEEVKRELLEIGDVNQFEDALNQGLLLIVDFESEIEEATFVNYAVNLDVGEAAIGALS